jgi:hypothetical protein
VAVIDYPTVQDALQRAVPRFGWVVREHVADYDDVLPHLLFGDLTRFVLAAHDAGDDGLVGQCLDFLDLALRDGDPAVQNLVAVSFVENVPPSDESRQGFIESWPEGLRREAEQQRAWTPGNKGSAWTTPD